MTTANLNDNILFKVVDGKLTKPNRQEMKRYFQYIMPMGKHSLRSMGQYLIEEDLFVSFRYEEDKKDLSVFIWTEDYSIGVTYDEFMAIYDAIKDKRGLINEIVANRV